MIALLLTAHGFATPSTTYTATLTVSAGAVERAAGSSVTKKLNLKRASVDVKLTTEM